MSIPPTPLYTAHEIDQRVSELAAALEARFAAGVTPHLVGVLKGGFVFLADLIRAMSRPVTIDFLRVESYGASTTSSGAPRLLGAPSASLHGRDVVLVEDIVDSGLTLQTVRRTVLSHRPRSLSTVALLSKPARRRVDVPIELVGFSIDDEFVVGYGLDVNESHRDLPYLGVVAPS